MLRRNFDPRIKLYETEGTTEAEHEPNSTHVYQWRTTERFHIPFTNHREKKITNTRIFTWMSRAGFIQCQYTILAYAHTHSNLSSTIGTGKNWISFRAKRRRKKNIYRTSLIKPRRKAVLTKWIHCYGLAEGSGGGGGGGHGSERIMVNWIIILVWEWYVERTCAQPSWAYSIWKQNARARIKVHSEFSSPPALLSWSNFFIRANSERPRTHSNTKSRRIGLAARKSSAAKQKYYFDRTTHAKIRSDYEQT